MKFIAEHGKIIYGCLLIKVYDNVQECIYCKQKSHISQGTSWSPKKCGKYKPLDALYTSCYDPGYYCKYKEAPNIKYIGITSPLKLVSLYDKKYSYTKHKYTIITMFDKTDINAFFDRGYINKKIKDNKLFLNEEDAYNHLLKSQQERELEVTMNKLSNIKNKNIGKYFSLKMDNVKHASEIPPEILKKAICFDRH